MPTVTIKPGKDVQIRFPVPKSRVIEYEVEAEYPVSTFIVDEEGLQQYRKNGSDSDITSYYGGFHRRYNHHQELRLPFTGWWYLVIENLEDHKSVAVHYEVSG
jgi:hypothetical protein